MTMRLVPEFDAIKVGEVNNGYQIVPMGVHAHTDSPIEATYKAESRLILALAEVRELRAYLESTEGEE